MDSLSDLQAFLDSVNMTRFNDLTEFIRFAIQFSVRLIALVAVIYLIIAGFNYIISKGEGEKAEQAQKAIIYALIGLLIAFLAPFLVDYILENLLQVTTTVAM